MTCECGKDKDEENKRAAAVLSAYAEKASVQKWVTVMAPTRIRMALKAKDVTGVSPFSIG